VQLVHFVTAVCAATFNVDIAVRVPREKMFDIRHGDSECSTWSSVHCASGSSNSQ
jgi:hypothetical protein